MITSIPMALAAGSALLAAAITFYIILFVFSKISNKSGIEKINSFISPMAWNLAFLISLFSLLGSLFFSEVLGFQPCVLCWYQRVFMYPLPLILYISMIKGEMTTRVHASLLAAIGALFALYHYSIQVFPQLRTISCEALGPVSCTEGYTFYFGFVSIPFMALTAFIAVIVLLQISSSDA